MDTLFFYFYGSAMRVGDVSAEDQDLLGSLHSTLFHLSHAQLRLLTQRIHSHHHILRQGQHRFKVCLAPGPFYVLPSLLEPDFCSLQTTCQYFHDWGFQPRLWFPVAVSPHLSILQPEMFLQVKFQHTHTHTHTPLQFPHSEILCENNGNCGNPCCLSTDFFFERLMFCIVFSSQEILASKGKKSLAREMFLEGPENTISFHDSEQNISCHFWGSHSPSMPHSQRSSTLNIRIAFTRPSLSSEPVYQRG